MAYTVRATGSPAEAAHSTPKISKQAARTTARRKDRAPVTTAPAMALGASVQPLTTITPKVSRAVTARAGLCPNSKQKARKVGMDSTSMPTVWCYSS